MFISLAVPNVAWWILLTKARGQSKTSSSVYTKYALMARCCTDIDANGFWRRNQHHWVVAVQPHWLATVRQATLEPPRSDIWHGDGKSDRRSQCCRFRLFLRQNAITTHENSYTSKSITFSLDYHLLLVCCASIDDFNPRIFIRRDQLDIVRTHDFDWWKINFWILK